MKNTCRKLAVFLCAFLPQAGSLLAQSITISPTSPSVGVGSSVQFSAQTTGLGSAPVTWTAGGYAGGNSTVGTIDSTGLYTAPATVPSGASVRIVASAVSGALSASAKTSVSILAAGPTITSVSPNPLPPGTFTVTVLGSGFQTGATVFDGVVQLTTVTGGAGSITATGYQGPATSTTFCVKNPGTACGNSLSVPVGPATSSGGGTSGGGTGAGGSGSSNIPVLTSVTPNPLPVGTDTITILGSGFQTGALVYDSYGTNSMIQTAPTTVSAGSITVTIYQGSATTSTFCVKNPGTACSNSITVPVAAASSGSGGGSGSGGSSNVPVLTSVTPNPLPVGTDTITILGSGFLTGALVYDSYGTNSMIQTAPTTVAAGSITVTIYQGSATTSTFCVKNPGTACSNSISVPVTAASSGSGGGGGTGNATYTLTVVNGTANGSATGSFAAGAVVTLAANAPPPGEAFQAWTGAPVANTIASSTTLTMPSENLTVTANFYTPAPIPFPVTTHPRLWLTQQDLPRLQSWANSGNVAYQGQTGPLFAAIGNYQLFFPGAALGAINPTPANPYPDPGDSQGYDNYLSEENAFILAFNSLIDPSATNRAQYAQAARNLLMVAMNQAALGPSNGAPFRDPSFPIYNRASFTGHEWPLIVDWIYPILSASDKATIRTAFMIWASECLTAETTGGDNPGEPGLENSLALLPNNLPYRFASNNYYLAHARLLTMISLALDPADDPPLNPAVPAAALGNTLRSYLADATGAWLYEEFAMMGDPQVVAQAYGVPNNPTGAGFGLASGGLPPEGMLYGESFGYVLGQLLALQTAGFNNATYSGPQIGLIGAPVWDRFTTGYISSLVPAPQTFPSELWNGSVYQFAGYGDLLRTFVTPDQMAPWALLGLLDQETGVSTHVNAARWFALNAMPNGAPGLLTRMVDPWTWGVTQDVLYYMLLDPTAPGATDPRPSFPTVFYDPPAGRIVAHSDWTPTGTMFDYRASWISINHQDGNGGQFELYRKGEWLTKEMSNYDNNGQGQTVIYHNTLGLQNWCAPCATITWQGPDGPIYANGSQWMLGEDAGDPTTIMSTGPGYVFAASNLVNLYNKAPNIWTPADSIDNITQATRSILWLNNDYIVVYDRATSINSGLFKRFYLSLDNPPAIHGNTATETLASGQQLFIQTLLPLAPSLSSFNGAANLTTLADLEPTQYIYQVQDPSLPLDTRFLHVLQGADAGASMAAATYLQSTAGTPFDGAHFATSEVWFPVSANGVFSGCTLPGQTGVRTVIVTGLTPNAAFGISINGNSVTVSPSGSTVTADAAGVLVIPVTF
jgi:hypothetical protein